MIDNKDHLNHTPEQTTPGNSTQDFMKKCLMARFVKFCLCTSKQDHISHKGWHFAKLSFALACGAAQDKTDSEARERQRGEKQRKMIRYEF